MASSRGLVTLCLPKSAYHTSQGAFAPGHLWLDLLRSRPGPYRTYGPASELRVHRIFFLSVQMGSSLVHWCESMIDSLQCVASSCQGSLSPPEPQVLRARPQSPGPILALSTLQELRPKPWRWRPLESLGRISKVSALGRRSIRLAMVLIYPLFFLPVSSVRQSRKVTYNLQSFLSHACFCGVPQ